MNTTWKLWFAWYPVITIRNNLVWLRYVKRRWNWDLNPWIYLGYSGTDGGLEYETRIL